MIKYYADFVGSSNDMCLTEPSENGQTFPSLFLPLLAVSKVKNIEVTSISSKYLGPSAFATNLYWNHCIETHFFNGVKLLALNFSQNVSKPKFKWCVFAMYTLSPKPAKHFQRCRVLDLNWLETNILCQLDVSRLDDLQPALVLITPFITKNSLMSLYLCIGFLGSFNKKSMWACFTPGYLRFNFSNVS